MALFIGLIFSFLISLTVCNVIYYQPEAVHLAYGGNIYSNYLVYTLFFFKLFYPQ